VEIRGDMGRYGGRYGEIRHGLGASRLRALHRYLKVLQLLGCGASWGGCGGGGGRSGGEGGVVGGGAGGAGWQHV